MNDTNHKTKNINSSWDETNDKNDKNDKTNEFNPSWKKFFTSYFIINTLYAVIHISTVDDGIPYATINIIGIMIQFAVMFFPLFIIGLIASWVYSLFDKEGNSKNASYRFIRGIHITIPIALFAIYLSHYANELLKYSVQ